MVALASAVPFIGFGFMDNAIMIMAGPRRPTALAARQQPAARRAMSAPDARAGDLIEFQLGTLLSVSTMGAAAIGNLISDVAGVGLGSQARAPSLSE